MTFERAEVARWLFWGKGDNVGRSGDSFLPLRGQQQFPHLLCLGHHGDLCLSFISSPPQTEWPNIL